TPHGAQSPSSGGGRASGVSRRRARRGRRGAGHGGGRRAFRGGRVVASGDRRRLGRVRRSSGRSRGARRAPSLTAPALRLQSSKHEGAGALVAEKATKSRSKATKGDDTPMGPTGRPYQGFATPEPLASHGPARIIALCNQKGGVGK